MSIDGSSLMTHRFRPAIALALGLLVAACGGGGSDNFDLFQPPDTPGSLTAELAPDHESVLLRWTAPTPSDNRAPVTGYAVYLEPTGGQAQRLGETQSLSYRHTGLSPGTRYVFHVRALSAVGPSEPSESAFVDVPPVPSLPPEPPGSLNAELTPDSDALLTWTAPAPSPDRSPVTGYAVYLESTGGQAQRLGTTQSLSYRHTGLLSGTRYVFHVRALSAVGPSEPSESAFVDVPPVPSLPPEPPGSLNAELTPDSDALLTWTAPAPSPDRSPVTGYAVYLESTGGQAQRLGTTQSLSYRHTGLLSGARYVFHVRALSAAGPSEPSAAAFVDVPPVQSPPDSPGQPSVRLTPDNDALLSWTAPAPSPDRSPVTGYAVFLESAGGQAQRLGVTGARSYLHSGLLPGESYVFHVRALSAVGPSGPSASASVDVPPGPTLPPEVPGSFAAELTPEHDALLRWEAPAPSADRAPVTRYQVYLESAGGVVRQIGVTRALSYLHSGLLPGRRYVFHVRAASDAGVSDPSASEYVDVPLGPSLLPPEPPGNFTAELSPNLEALLRWVPPTPSDDPDRAPSPATGSTWNPPAGWRGHSAIHNPCHIFIVG